MGTKLHPLDARHAQLATLHVPRDPVVFKSRWGENFLAVLRDPLALVY